MKKLTKAIVSKILKPRPADSHKGNHGHALIVAGSKGRMGAAVIAARACLRTGAGLLTVNVPEEERFVLQMTIPEAMVDWREKTLGDLSKYSAIGIGPAIGTGKVSFRILEGILKQALPPLVLDADALTLLAANDYLIDQLPSGSIVTPHPKEFDRLFGTHPDMESRFGTAIKKATEHNIIVVLKSHQTLITSAGGSFLSITGNAGLAKGGSGDGLTGMVTAFLAQGYAPFDAARIAVYLHGSAADIALKAQSVESMMITDVIDCLGNAFKNAMGNKS